MVDRINPIRRRLARLEHAAAHRGDLPPFIGLSGLLALAERLPERPEPSDEELRKEVERRAASGLGIGLAGLLLEARRVERQRAAGIEEMGPVGYLGGPLIDDDGTPRLPWQR